MNTGERADDPNLARLSLVIAALGELSESLVRVGGCATGLLVTVARAQPIRATLDVDIVVQVTTMHDYHDMEAALRARGLTNDTSPGAPICRWLCKGVALDLMPTAPGILGFHNRWYPLAFETAREITLPDNQRLRLIQAPLFIATKLEAFNSRGAGDYLMSHDLEDIITVVDGRPELLDEARAMPVEARRYVAGELSRLMQDDAFIGALAGHLPGDAASQQRLPALGARLRELSELKGK